MAKVIVDNGGVTHLRSVEVNEALCGEAVASTTMDGELTCPKCAEIALLAVELVTKAEKREWRKL